MTQKDKCFKCEYLTRKGILISKDVVLNKDQPHIKSTISKPKEVCDFKNISLNNLVIKECTNFRLSTLLIQQKAELNELAYQSINQ